MFELRCSKLELFCSVCAWANALWRALCAVCALRAEPGLEARRTEPAQAAIMNEAQTEELY